MRTNNIWEGKSIALVIWNEAIEDDAHIYTGQLFTTEKCYIFRNNQKGWAVTLSDDALDNICAVREDLKEILLDADFYLNLTIGEIPDNEKELIPTGIKWHK